MNSNPDAKVVLCFGDSNTRGTRPDDGRYSANERWTGQLQARLGSDFYIIEEGLGGRTTNLESGDPTKPGRNGFSYFKPCLFSHSPIDVLLIMLGTNDFKNTYGRSAREVADALGEYCDFAAEFDSTMKLVLISPSLIEEVEPVEYYDQTSVEKSKQLAAEIKRIASSKQVHFFDAADVAKLGEDGLHWEKESESLFAEKIAELVREIA